MDMVKLKNSEKNMLCCHFVCHKFHIHWPGTELEGLSSERLRLTSWAHCLYRPQIITDLNKPSRHYSIESLSDTSWTTIVGGVHCSSSCADSTKTTWKWPIRCRGNILSTNTAMGWNFNYFLPQWVGTVLLHILQCTNGLYSFFHMYILWWLEL